MLALLQSIFDSVVKVLGLSPSADKRVTELLKQMREKNEEHRLDRDEWREQLSANDARWKEWVDNYQAFADDMSRRSREYEAEMKKVENVVERERVDHRKCRQEIAELRSHVVTLEDENRELKRRVATLETQG